MKHIYLILSVLLFFSLYTSCLDDPDMDTRLQNAKKPEVSQVEKVDVFASTIKLKASIVKEHGSPIRECGVCWGEDETALPIEHIRNSRKAKADKINGKDFTATISNLKDSTKYYIYAYAINEIDTAFSGYLACTTVRGVGDVSTLPVDSSKMKATSAWLEGLVKSRGEGIEQLGFYYSEKNREPNPELDSVVYYTGVDLTSVDTFSCQITNLKPAKLYYVRAFAKNRFGEFSFNVDSFRTTDGKPHIGSVSIDSTSFTSADLSAILSQEGDSPVKTFGFCWSVDEKEPTIQGGADTIICTKLTDQKFNGRIRNLESSKTYYARAYATNDFGTSYSSVIVQISTKNKEPNLSTFPLEEGALKDGSATVGGKLLNGGESEAVKWGICWSENKIPTIKDAHIENPDSLFTCTLSNLTGATTYYYRAYATNKSGLTGYGSVQQFRTPNIFEDVTLSGMSNRISSAAFTAGNTAYIVGGDQGPSRSKDLLSYIAGSDKWNPMIEYLCASGRMTACVKDGLAYVMGGLSASEKLASFYIYDVSPNVWIDKLPTPDWSPRYDAISFAYRDSIYLLGGEANGKSSELWRYDIVNKSWKMITGFPKAQDRGMALVVDNKVYAGLGDGAGGQLWYASDSLTNWTLVSPTKTNVGIVHAAVYLKNEKWNSFFMINKSGKIWEYQLSNTKWIEHKAFPISENYHMFILQDKIYILGQNLYNDSYFKTYDPAWDPGK